jgi:hypothetical protein
MVTEGSAGLCEVSMFSSCVEVDSSFLGTMKVVSSHLNVSGPSFGFLWGRPSFC